MEKVYLAGPDVFFKDREARFLKLEALCHSFGLKGIRPADGEGVDPLSLQGRKGAEYFYTENMARLKSCDAAIFNLEAFRNPLEPDSGTVFELATALASGIPVAGYFSEANIPLRQRTETAFGPLTVDGEKNLRDHQFGLLVEDFDLPLNLMLGVSCPLFTSPAFALAEVKSQLSIEPLNVLLSNEQPQRPNEKKSPEEGL
ncbi:nucleoside 2-deoxyribosyltransferase [Nostoc sp. CHAB 5834]|nr:nucleoside 2-deoxyribosyltransferase [Nostoc sp. CHAB 5834]